ncbi:urokinase plasminogen activator surface receptor-like [Scomber scombrus]|uniref:Urokinase plasminogen activator surface receptor-like n=1 Tax=Scomber scombrus TaxID=13677 RepID=A0AAV1QN17_SCOSC
MGFLCYSVWSVFHFTDNTHRYGTQSNYRMCFPSSLFSEGKHTFSYSIGTVAMTASVHFCNTDGCNSEDIPHPGDQKKNGRQCITCDPSSSVCNQTVQCVGVEDRCFNMTGEPS